MIQNISNLVNSNGNFAANQFVITTSDAVYFQSYQSVVCKIKDNKLTLSRYWNYSATTRKHVFIFIRKYMPMLAHICNTSAMRNAISNGDVIVESVNSIKIG